MSPPFQPEVAALVTTGPSAASAVLHPASWLVGWGLVACGFASGAALGLAFHRDDFLGGYASWRRRLLRLGHVALVALGILNLLYALSPWPAPGTTAARLAGIAFASGGTLMPLVCALCAARPALRHAFCVPVALLATGAVLVLLGSLGA